MGILKSMFTEEADIHICTNCDAEYSITLISNDDDQPCFCPFCGNDYYDEEDDSYEQEENDEQ
jgi:uncharacterized paraquat-inducible protein A